MWELQTAARIVSQEVGTGEYFRGSDDQVRIASEYIAWTMRNRLEIGDPCVGCSVEMNLTASTYEETFPAYDPYRLQVMPDVPDPIVLQAVREVWNLPAGTPNPVNNADYILGKYYYEANQSRIAVAPVFHYFWIPLAGGNQQGIYFFAEWPVAQ
ncbi:hypothetical protein GF380_06360 [Candidatus Uhrbacteria bacterium]|nr:hypothetical protein [Candidatus Uhrbacteria bacterium]